MLFSPLSRDTLVTADCKDGRKSSQAESEARLNKKSKIKLKNTLATVNAERQKKLLQR